MVGGRLRQVEAQKRLKRPAITAAPGDGPLRIETLEKADEEHPEVDPRRNARAATSIAIIWTTKILYEFVELCFAEKSVELGIERMAR